MRDLIITENITLDGVIDGAGDWFNVANQPGVDQSDLVAALQEQSEASDAFLVGRVTFEGMRGYWPHQKDDPSGVSEYLNKVSKYVVSRTMRLFVYPVVLGGGEKLFTGGTDVLPLRLVETRPFRSGVVLLRYRAT